MELRHIQYFVAVAEELHFGRAARRVHIAQPPLSQQIKQLEHELGAPLFYRTKRTVELTPAGEALLPYAKTLLDQARLCADVVRSSSHGETGTLRIGYVEEAVHFVFPYFLNKFQAMYPLVQIQLVEMHSHDQIAALQAGKIDFAFGYSTAKSPALAGATILKGRILLALPSAHPLATQRTISLSQCHTEPFIFPVRATSPHLYDFMLSICTASSLNPKIAYHAEHVYTVMGLVRSGLGMTLFPAFLNQDEWTGVAFRPLKGKQFNIEMRAHWIKSHAAWTTHQNFLKAFRTAF